MKNKYEGKIKSIIFEGNKSSIIFEGNKSIIFEGNKYEGNN